MDVQARATWRWVAGIHYATDGQKGFLGFEVKYHENLANLAGKHPDRHSEVAAAMGHLSKSAEVELRKNRYSRSGETIF